MPSSLVRQLYEIDSVRPWLATFSLVLVPCAFISVSFHADLTDQTDYSPKVR